MTKKHELNKQYAIIEQIISQLDLSGMMQEKLFGQDGIIKNLTSIIFLNERLTGCFFKFPSFSNRCFQAYIVTTDTLKTFLVYVRVCPSCQYSKVLLLYFSS